MPAFIDMTGQRFGRLLVIERVESPNKKRTMWRCLCDCGNITITDGVFIRSGDTRSCGCIQKEWASKSKLVNLAGQRFGRLVVLERAENSPHSSHSRWLCCCDCGVEKIVSSQNLTNGKTRSCGWKCSLGVFDSKNLIDETGNVYGKLTVVKRDRDRTYGKTRERFVMWICRCECGNRVSVAAQSLREGRTKSCGCLRGNATAFHAFYLRMKMSAETKHEWDLTEDFVKQVTSQNCIYCGKKPSQIYRHRKGIVFYNGLDRVDSDKEYTEDNVVPCCIQCNRAKNSYPVDVFKNLIQSIYSHWASK